MRASDFLARLDKIDFASIATSVARVAAGMDAIVNSPNTKAMIENLNATVGEFGATAKQLAQLARHRGSEHRPAADSIAHTSDTTRQTLQTATDVLQRMQLMFDPNAPAVYELRPNARRSRCRCPGGPLARRSARAQPQRAAARARTSRNAAGGRQ